MSISTSGRQSPPELTVSRDPVSGAMVRQLTNYRAHSNHSYFTYPCWYAGGRRLVIASDRGNRVNLFGVDIETGRAWKIRPTVPGECVGHEYWMSDGERIGYHGGNDKGGLYGSIRYDNTDHVEVSFSGHCWHFHSHLLDLVVGDGNAQDPYLLAWRFRNGAFEGPKVLAWHRGSFHSQQLHVHPCVHANGTRVLYTADPQAYGQVFIVDVPEWETLPDRSAVTRNKEV